MGSPAVTIQNHDSPIGRWEFINRAPPPELRPHVLGYLGYREWTPAPFRRLEVPSGEVHVIISFGPEVRVPAPVRSFVAAPHTEHAIVFVVKQIRAGELGKDVHARCFTLFAQPGRETIQRDDVVAVVLQWGRRDGRTDRVPH